MIQYSFKSPEENVFCLLTNNRCFVINNKGFILLFLLVTVSLYVFGGHFEYVIISRQ